VWTSTRMSTRMSTPLVNKPFSPPRLDSTRAARVALIYAIDMSASCLASAVTEPMDTVDQDAWNRQVWSPPSLSTLKTLSPHSAHGGLPGRLRTASASVWCNFWGVLLWWSKPPRMFSSREGGQRQPWRTKHLAHG
jgi:hypothetical protein